MPDPLFDATPAEIVARLIEEGPIGMSQAARLTGTFRQGKPTHPSTVARWTVKGVTIGDGHVVKLESFRLNGRLCTSKAALIRFIAAQNTPPIRPAAPMPRSPAARSRAAQAATAELDRLGI